MPEGSTNGLVPRALGEGGYRWGPEGEERLSKQVLVKLTLDQMQALQRAAIADNTSPPGYLRNLLIRALKG